jgi:hypothetical protein
MFLLLDRDEGRASALVAALVEHGVEARACHNAFDARAALEGARPEAVVVALEGLDGAAVGQALGRGAAFGTPFLDVSRPDDPPALFTGGSRSLVYRTFKACWMAGREFRWRPSAASPADLATWLVEQARLPAQVGKPPRTQLWSGLISLLLAAPAMVWAFRSGPRDSASAVFLGFLLVANGVTIVPPAASAWRRDVPLSFGAWTALGLLLAGAVLVVASPFVLR